VTIAEQLEQARGSWGDEGEAVLESGLTYDGEEPVRVHVRKRGRRYDISDQGAAVEKAGVKQWQETAERTVAEEGFNVNRAGVVFVPVVEGRDIAELAGRLAATSRAVYAELLAQDD
jgi:hypothetical protein